MFDYFCKKYSQLSTLSTKRVTPLNIEVSVIPFYLFVKRDAVRPFFAVSIAISALYAPSSPSFQILFMIEYVHIVSKIVWFWYDDSMMVWKWYDCMTSVWWFVSCVCEWRIANSCEESTHIFSRFLQTPKYHTKHSLSFRFLQLFQFTTWLKNFLKTSEDQVIKPSVVIRFDVVYPRLSLKTLKSKSVLFYSFFYQ